MKKIEMVCIDLDGTLVAHSSNNVSAENLEAMKQAGKQGVHVVINTGRSLEYCRELAQNIDFKGELITGCGSRIYKFPEAETIIKNVLTYENAQKYIEHVAKKGIIMLLCSKDKAFITKSDLKKLRAYEGHWHQNAPFGNTVDSYEDIMNLYPDDIDKVEGFAPPQVLDELEVWIEENMPGTTSARTGSKVLEVYSTKAGKGNALAVLAESLNIKTENVMAIGDSGNDLHMFEAAGLSVAMGNSPDHIKEKCDYITDEYANNGVAKAIKKFILDK